MTPEELTQKLLRWYDRERRDLPWRTEKDPYRIWVSEVMLQQTRVETVVPYYDQFLRRFPDMPALSAASEEDLLAAWQGLGYYSRVRNLQRGVREVMARYGGRVPDSREKMISLPGIGSYTAGAILSIAYNQTEPAVDGNVLRVFSRLLPIEEPVDRPPVKRRVEAETRALLAAGERCGDITQALMELGALVCIPRRPRCEQCPWQDGCAAFANNRQAELPKRKIPPTVQTLDVYTGILVINGKVLAVKRPSRGLLAGMWEFPSVEMAAGAETKPAGIRLLGEWFKNRGLDIIWDSEWFSLAHTFSHRQWKIRIFRCHLSNLKETGLQDACWLDLGRLNEMTWAGPHRKIAERLAAKTGVQP